MSKNAARDEPGSGRLLALGVTAPRASDDDRSSACRSSLAERPARRAEGAQSQSNGGFGLQMGNGREPRWRGVRRRLHRQRPGDQWPGAVSSPRRRPIPPTRSACLVSRCRRPISTPRCSPAAACGPRKAIRSTPRSPTAESVQLRPGQRPDGRRTHRRRQRLRWRAGALQRDRHLVGGIGVSGDSSCADHNTPGGRAVLNLDYVPAGVSDDPARKDNISTTSRPKPDKCPASARTDGATPRARPRPRRSPPIFRRHSGHGR